jgi:hypothetical protein
MKKVLLLLLLLPVFVLIARADDRAEVMKVSKQAILALKSKNMSRLAALAHPTKGVRFSPYGYIDKESNLIFKRAQIAGLWNNRRIYDWGPYDAGEEEIKMRFSKYYGHFIYDRDFARAPQVGYNRVVERGNAIVDIAEKYPKGKFVEYNFPEGADGNVMGWNSLRLVFEKQGGRWYLVGISHDEWTT